MPTQRIHKVLLDPTRNHFAHLSDPASGKTLDLNSAAASANPRWQPYDEVCVEAWELYPHEAPDGTHQMWVLRAHVRCCCAGACKYAWDHAAHDSYAKISATAPDAARPAQTTHGPGQGYIEAQLAMSDLSALAAQASAVAGDATARATLAQALTADAAKFGLSVGEIEGLLGVVAEGGLLSAPAATTGVLEGTSTVANDYYVVAAAVKLWQRLVHACFLRLARDWPQRGVARPMRLGPRQVAGGAQ